LLFGLFALATVRIENESGVRILLTTGLFPDCDRYLTPFFSSSKEEEKKLFVHDTSILHKKTNKKKYHTRLRCCYCCASLNADAV
jgi:hypothetical protein